MKCAQWPKELRLLSLNDWVRYFSVAVKRIYKTSSPVDYYPYTREEELKCTFKGWPRPRVVWYTHPGEKQIINGSEGFYISEQLVEKDILSSLLRNLNIQEKHEGAYKCTGLNNIAGWSSEKLGITDLNYRCESFNFIISNTTHGCAKLPPLKQVHKKHNTMFPL